MYACFCGGGLFGLVICLIFLWHIRRPIFKVICMLVIAGCISAIFNGIQGCNKHNERIERFISRDEKSDSIEKIPSYIFLKNKLGKERNIDLITKGYTTLDPDTISPGVTRQLILATAHRGKTLYSITSGITQGPKGFHCTHLEVKEIDLAKLFEGL